MISDSRQKYIKLALRRNPTSAVLMGRGVGNSDAGAKNDSEFGIV
jgi:hypothetical protein